jgi:uncharacterized protein
MRHSSPPRLSYPHSSPHTILPSRCYQHFTALTAFRKRSTLPFFSTGCGSAWLERHVRDVEAVGSNPTSPIDSFKANSKKLFRSHILNRMALDGRDQDRFGRNVLGTELECCCTDPVTGYFRDGYCRTDATDSGHHFVCAEMTAEFLRFSVSRGNDLVTPQPEYDFPGLNPGDRWCLCVERWVEALEAGCAPPVFLEATYAGALEYVSRSELEAHAKPF